MADLALFVRVGDRTSLQLLHRCKGSVKPRLQLIKVRCIHVHPADIQPDAQILVKPEEVTEALPLNLSVADAEIREAHQADHIALKPKLSRINGTAHLLGHHG